MKHQDAILKLLSFLGLNFTEAQVFLSLAENGESTIVQIAKITKIPRTTIYRIIENLLAIGVLEEIVFGKKKLYKNVGTHRLEILIKEKESQLEYIQKILPDINNILPSHRTISQIGSKVLFYNGRAGIEQMLSNSLRANGSILHSTIYTIEELTDHNFALSFQIKLLERGISVFDLVGEDKFTKKRCIPRYGEFSFKNLEVKYTYPKNLQIPIQTDIYNNVVAFYYKENKDFYGIEIYNESINSMQKQLFSLAWNLGVLKT